MSVDHYKWVNLLRHMEQTGPEALRADIDSYAVPVEKELRQDPRGFTSKVTDRAAQVIDLLGLRNDYAKFTQRSRSFSWAIFIGMALLGFFAVMQTLSNETHTLNVYWLLLILLGINAVSMVLWVLVILRSFKGSNDSIRTQSPLTRLYRKILSAINRDGRTKSMLASWAEVYLLGRVGKWFSSKNLHTAWLMYLLGGTVALLIALSGKQYDFVWGSTILGSDTFVSLTQALAALPRQLGFIVPSSEQVLVSRQGVAGIDLDRESLRGAWAGFIFACVLLYAVLPRLLLWLASTLLLRRAESQYEPDWDLPYFYRLRTRLLPASTSLGVVDSDQSNDVVPPQSLQADLGHNITKLETYLQGGDAAVAVYEWGLDPLPEAIAALNPAIINDLQSQQAYLSGLASNPRESVLIVPLERAADRGAARFFADILQVRKLTVLLVRSKRHEAERARWAGWQALAERLKLPASQLILVSLT